MAEGPVAPVADPAPPDSPPRAATAPTTAERRFGIATLPRRAVGVALVALSVVPAWHLLDDPATGLAGSATAALMRDLSALAWSGALLALVPLVLLVVLGARLPLQAWLDGAARRIDSIAPAAFAALLFAIGTSAALAFGFLALDAQPNLIDAMAQLAHARRMAAGHLATPVELAEFQFVTNSIVVEHGLVSHYPPGHTVLLALGMLVRAEWLIGPLALGVTLAAASFVAERVLPHARVAARALLLLACASPFLVSHAGAYMNHTTAAAFVTLALLFVLRARDGDARWAIAAGVAASIALAVRPLSALVMIGAATLAAWLPARDAAWFGRRFALAVAGALPLTLLHLAYNAHFFGSPFMLGYVVAMGPAQNLGLGIDPWGNAYGLTQALAYTSADLAALSLALFEVPLPVVALIGAFLLLARRLDAGERVLAAWAVAPVAVNALYWHHGNFMGPRMLNEAAPAWILLAAATLAWLLHRVPVSVRSSASARAPRPLRAPLAAALVVVALASLTLLVPARYASYAASPLDVPAPDEPALVFVHGPFIGRVGARLGAAGIRTDSIEAALRQNSTCAVASFADRYEAGTPPSPPIDATPAPQHLAPRAEISPGNFIRVRPDETLSAACVEEIRADRHGVLELAPFLWHGVTPGEAGGVLFARDMGPARNRRLIDAEPGRTTWLYAATAADSAARLMPYDEGMRLLWQSTTGQVSR